MHLCRKESKSTIVSISTNTGMTNSTTVNRTLALSQSYMIGCSMLHINGRYSLPRVTYKSTEFVDHRSEHYTVISVFAFLPMPILHRRSCCDFPLIFPVVNSAFSLNFFVVSHPRPRFHREKLEVPRT